MVAPPQILYMWPHHFQYRAAAPELIMMFNKCFQGYHYFTNGIVARLHILQKKNVFFKLKILSIVKSYLLNISLYCFIQDENIKLKTKLVEQEESGETNAGLVKQLHDTAAQLEKEKMNIEMHYVRKARFLFKNFLDLNMVK